MPSKTRPTQVPAVTIRRSKPQLDEIQATHVLVLCAQGFDSRTTPGEALRAAIASRAPAGSASKAAAGPVVASTGTRMTVWAVWNRDAPAFEQNTALRKALEPLLKESPAEIAIVIHAAVKDAPICAAQAVYTAAVNGRYRLGKVGKAGKADRPATEALRLIQVFGAGVSFAPAHALAAAAGNLLARSLTLRPANDLTPKRYRRDIAALAKAEGWKHRELDLATLRKMGAGAFCAVAQGSPQRDAAIVHLSYRPRRAKKGVAAIALVGKGICMDTGGHGLKSAKHMYGMHEDMNGSAVVLGILKAASDLQWPVAIDAWLAIAQNHIGPEAYQPGDVITSLDGTTIEIVHTDAEGRMVLADALTLAARDKPGLIIDFATLTGAMLTALGTRMCGIFANRPALAAAAVAGGIASGERVCAFPLEADYDEPLESKVADVKQCLMEGEADAIYGARLLSRFVKDTPWIHVDLCAYRHEGGLGAISGDVSGFGVAWGLAVLQKQMGP